MNALSRDLSDLFSLDLDEEALAALEWRKFGNGVKLGKLVREGDASLVLY